MAQMILILLQPKIWECSPELFELIVTCFMILTNSKEPTDIAILEKYSEIEEEFI